MPTVSSLPQWDLSTIFPSIDSKELDVAIQKVLKELDEYQKFFDENQIDRRVESAISDKDIQCLEEIIRRFNKIEGDARVINAFIMSVVTTDSFNETAQAKLSAFQSKLMPISKLCTRLSAWVGSLDIEDLLKRSEVARENEFELRKRHKVAQHLMSSEEEALAAELTLTGLSAWSKLHGTMTSQLNVKVQFNGRPKMMPMSEVRNLASDPDRETRRTAYHAELEAWKGVEVPMAAAMNSIKGEMNTLCERRGWSSPLERALFSANIDRETLDAMMSAAHDSFVDFRRYLHAKAKCFGLQKLAWFDMFAPMTQGSNEWSYDEAKEFIASEFSAFWPRMGELAQKAFDENWIDAGPKYGKRDGAFCMGVRPGESRVLMNFKPTFSAVSTLAHELGHAYHNLCLGHRTEMQRSTPMTLAETASIFCETIIRSAGLKRGSEAEQIAILEASIQGSCQVVVDITSRFLFEQSVFADRVARELSPHELCDLMLDAQKKTYGDGLDEEFLHPYMWAVKGHYYGANSFYNFPYMFGLLFGLGLYALYEAEPKGFCERYDDLLSSTGLADAATLADRFGIDIRSTDFWTASLNQIRKDIDRFVALVG